MKGRIDQGRPVYLEGDIEELKGKLVPVEIFDAGNAWVGQEEEGEEEEGAGVGVTAMPSLICDSWRRKYQAIPRKQSRDCASLTT